MKRVTTLLAVVVSLNAFSAKSIFGYIVDSLTNRPRVEAIEKPKKFVLNFSTDAKTDKANGLPVVKRVVEKECPFKTGLESAQFVSGLIDLFMARRFDKLNQELKRINGMRSIHGNSLISKVIESLHSRYKGIETATAWNGGEFHSEFSECVLGNYLLGKAWKARGHGFASSVSAEGWASFETYKKQARQCYDRAIAINPSFSPPVASIAGLAGSGSSIKELNLWVNLSLKIEPWNTKVITTAFSYLQPRWGGSELLLNHLAEQVKAVDQKKSPTILSLWQYMYSMIGTRKYKSLSNSQKKEYKQKMFKDLTTLYESRLRNIYTKSDGTYISLLGMADRFDLKPEFESTFQEAIQAFPNSYAAYYRKVNFINNCYYGREDEKFQLLKKVVEIYPGAGQAWFKMIELSNSKKGLSTKKEQKSFYEKARDNTSSDYYTRAIMGVKAAYLLDEDKVDEAVKILLKTTLVKEKHYATLCGKFSNYYYSEGSHYDPERGWAFYMLPWSLKHYKINHLPIEEMLKFSESHCPTHAEEWYHYIKARHHYSEYGKYPIKGKIKALRACVLTFDSETSKEIIWFTTDLLAKLIRLWEGPSDDIIRYSKMSLAAGITETNGKKMGDYLGYLASQNKKEKPHIEMGKYYTMSAEYIIKEKLLDGEYCEYYAKQVLFAAAYEYANSNPDKALELLSALLKLKITTKELRGDINFYYAFSLLDLKRYSEAKGYFKISLKQLKDKKSIYKAKENLEWLEKNKY